MELKDVQANQGNIDVVIHIVEKEEPRSFEKFGKTGRVCKAKVKDDTGEMKLTLWNDDIESVNVGDKVHLQNGWCSEYQGEKQLSSGKFGKIEILEKAAAGSNEVFTNDPGALAGNPMEGQAEEGESEEPGEDGPIDTEETVE